MKQRSSPLSTVEYPNPAIDLYRTAILGCTVEDREKFIDDLVKTVFHNWEHCGVVVAGDGQYIADFLQGNSIIIIGLGLA